MKPENGIFFDVTVIQILKIDMYYRNTDINIYRILY